MKIFRLKQGDTKLLRMQILRRNGPLSVTAQSGKLIIYLPNGSSAEYDLTAGTTASLWSYRFTAADVANLFTYVPSGLSEYDFQAEVVLVWSTGNQETAPTEGVNVIRVYKALPRA